MHVAFNFEQVEDTLAFSVNITRSLLRLNRYSVQYINIIVLELVEPVLLVQQMEWVCSHMLHVRKIPMFGIINMENVEVYFQIGFKVFIEYHVRLRAEAYYQVARS